MDKIHSIIKKLRIENGMTLKEVGDKIGVTESTVQRYESNKGIKAIPYDKIIAYSELFRVPPQFLITGITEENTEEIPLPSFTEENFEVLELFNKLTADQKLSIINLMKSMTN